MLRICVTSAVTRFLLVLKSKGENVLALNDVGMKSRLEPAGYMRDEKVVKLLEICFLSLCSLTGNINDSFHLS